ncbi:NHL domain-containing thioredoxin family protein [Kribbella sp. NBC_01245]|uniref:NHL domain-containing thioredoxin family protein n=1 Tax=Kribbella sp. NBC_01245 TaxID=2903578 RepID=UPI002E299999|nr:NHL domain-containing thioredoxin family protein [Kribbella sp. NBC_01245]
MRLRAPELKGRSWLNTGGVALGLGDFRGRFLLLDFWTFCCVNCLHVLDELRPLEEKYGDALVVVGVHSPKFAHEADLEAIKAAVERYEVGHPVLDDPELITWQNYTARAWPTLVLVDPNGYIVAQYSGEGHAHALDALLAEAIPEYEAAGALTRGKSPYVAPKPEPTDLRFPAKAITLPNGNLLVADAGHHSLVELATHTQAPGHKSPMNGDTPGQKGPMNGDAPRHKGPMSGDAEGVVRRVGLGERGLVDGVEARFSEPNGLALLPEDVALKVGYDVVVADTVNHALRGVALADGNVRTLVGTGAQWMDGDGTDVLSSPWDVAWWQDRVWIAMAGVHQLWTFDPLTGVTEVAAGTTNEGLRDGEPKQAWFAQTSGFAATAERLWFVDSETSSLRWISQSNEVHTAIGTGLFDFGLRGGKAEEALLQHPLGVTALPDGSVAIADTYNGAVRRFDPATGLVETMATGLAEPSGAVVAGNELLVVESAAHRLTPVPLGASAEINEFSTRTQRPPTPIAGGEITLEVVFEPPPGQKLDDRYGPSTRLMITSTPTELIREGAGDSTDLVRRLEIDPRVGDGVLHVAVQAASCDNSDEVEFPACHLHRQDWGVPVVVSPDGPPRLELVLSGAATP